MLLLTFLFLSQTPPAAAAPEPPKPPFPGSPPQNRFRSQLDTSPKIEAECQALGRLAAAKSWDEWLRRYQRLLDDHPDGLLPGGEDRLVGLRRTLEDRFRSLPAAARRRYRQQFDGIAAPALERAISQGEPAEVTRFYARYRFTSTGARAMAWLAQRALEGGDSERAWLAYSRLITDAAGSEPELPVWMAKAVMAGELSGHVAEAAAMADRLASRFGDRPLKIEGNVLPARVWVKARQAVAGAQDRSSRRGTTLRSDWPDFAGGSDGQRLMTGSVGPRLKLAWRNLAFPNGSAVPDYSEGTRSIWGPAYRNSGSQRFSYLPFATVADGSVYTQSSGSIRCLSFKDGKQLWSVREQDLAPQRRFPTPGGFRWWRPVRATQTMPVVAGHLLLARIPAGRFENDSSGWPAEFVLVALDTRTGALLWERSAANGPPDSFYNLPTVAGQTIYTGISTAMAGLTEYRAAALDAATGDRLWTTHLGSGSDPMAGVDGSPAAVRGGTVWVETCLHTVCALDALTGAVQWMVPFTPETNAPERSGWQDTMYVTNEPISLLALAGERLVFSPRWGSITVALSARTGHLVWSVDSAHSRSLVAVDDRRAVLVGDQIRSLDLATGRSQWDWTAPDRARIGYPALVGNQIVVPLGSTLAFLDATSGTELGRRSIRDFGAQSSAATVLVIGRRLLFAQADRLIAVDESLDESLAWRGSGELPASPWPSVTLLHQSRLGGLLRQTRACPSGATDGVSPHLPLKLREQPRTRRGPR
jgi:outer membrane protein assembly factor BamB